MEKRGKINKKKVCIVIILLFVIGIVAISVIVSHRKKKQTVETISEEVEKEEEIEEISVEEKNPNEKEEDTKNRNKIDFLENLEVPVYKKSQKNIKIPILIYHNFRTPIPYKEDVYKLFSSQENFDENVKTLLDAGYTFITLEDLYQYNKGEKGLPEKVMIITMDDGQIGCYTDAFPVLKKYQIPATIFIVNKLVGTPDYFSWEQAKEMYDTGLVKIHCHGYEHSAYSGVGKEKLVLDYKKSHQEIEQHMGEKVQKIMAYPAGKSSNDTIRWLKEIGFEVQVQTKYGTINRSKDLDLTGLGRIRGERATGKQILNAISAAKYY